MTSLARDPRRAGHCPGLGGDRCGPACAWDCAAVPGAGGGLCRSLGTQAGTFIGARSKGRHRSLPADRRGRPARMLARGSALRNCAQGGSDRRYEERAENAQSGNAGRGSGPGGCTSDPGFTGVSGVREATAGDVLACHYISDISMRPSLYGPVLGQEALEARATRSWPMRRIWCQYGRVRSGDARRGHLQAARQGLSLLRFRPSPAAERAPPRGSAPPPPRPGGGRNRARQAAGRRCCTRARSDRAARRGQAASSAT